MKFQVIANLQSNQIIAELTGEQIAEVIRVGGGIHGIPSYRHHIINLRATKDKTTQDRIKAFDLPAFIPSATYTGLSRATGSAYTVNQYMMLDVDGKDNPLLATQNESFDSKLYYHLLFRSPKGDGGRKLLIPVVLRNEYDYPTAYEQIKNDINKRLQAAGKPVVKFDDNAGKVTQLCLFSYDKNAEWEDSLESIQPLYSGMITKPRRGVTSLLSESDWNSVDTSSVRGLFDSTINKLKDHSIEWGKGTDAFLNEIYRLKLHGVGLPELVNLVHQHANGKYSRKHKKGDVTKKLSRLYNQYLTHVEPPVTVAATKTNHFQFINYITEHLQMVWDQLQQKQTLYIDAPTGAGKTSLIKGLARLSGLSIDLLCPTTALAQQQVGDGVLHVTGDGMLQADHYDASVLACCYESIAKIKKRQADILVIDEAHELASAYNYRSKAVQEIDLYSNSYKYVIYLSGSMFPIINDSNSDKVLRFERVNPKILPYSILTLGKREKDADYFASTLQGDTLNVFYKNDKIQLTALREYLTGKGKRVLMVSADDKLDAGYKELIENETLKEYDVLLSTCLLQSGVNVKDQRPVRILFGAGCNVLDYIQFTARFRSVIPTIEIIHCGEVKSLQSFNEQVAVQQINILSESYEKAIKINNNMKKNEKSFLSPQSIDGVRVDENGNYCMDHYYLLHKRNEVLNRNATSNMLFLQNTLRNFGFVFQQHIRTTAADTIGETQDRITTLTKEKRQMIADQLINGSYKASSTAGKDERELHQRYKRLQYIDVCSITSDILISSSTYKRVVDRALWEHLSYNKANGFALNEKAEVWYDKLYQLQQQVKPGKHDATSLTLIVQRVTGKSYNQIVKDQLGIIYDLTSNRVGKGSNRRTEYLVTSIKQATVKKVGVNIPDDFFDVE